MVKENLFMYSSSLHIFYVLFQSNMDIINTIKDELCATFVSLGIIVYLAILGIDLHGQFEISGEVHLQVHYKASVT
jgi:hypothetical protein